LEDLSEDDAIKIAKALGASVRDDLTPAIGVAQWKARVPAMQELLDTHLVLEPVLVRDGEPSHRSVPEGSAS